MINVPQRTTATHVSGGKTSLQGVSASKVIVSIGERKKNLKGMMKENLDADFFRMVYIHDRWFALVFKGL